MVEEVIQEQATKNLRKKQKKEKEPLPLQFWTKQEETNEKNSKKTTKRVVKEATKEEEM